MALLYPKVGDDNGSFSGQATSSDLMGMIGEPKRTFYLDNENAAAKEAKDFNGVPLQIFDFPLPSRG